MVVDARRIFGVLCSAVLLWAGGALAQGSALVVGAVVSQTGAHADLADPYRKALLLWEEQVNRAGGLLGRTVALKILDDRSDSTRTGPLYARLIGEERAEALIGPYGTAATMSAAAQAESAKRVLINGAGWSRAVHKRSPRYVFQSCPSYPAFAESVLELARARGYRRLAVLSRDEVAAREMAAGAAERAALMGLDAGEVIVYPADTEDFSLILPQARARNPDAWIAFGEVRDAAAMVIAMKKARYAPMLFFARRASDRKIIEFLGQDAELALGVTEYDPRLRTPGNEQFVAAYTARWGLAPNAAAAEGYAAATVLGDAVRRAGTAEADKLRAAILARSEGTVLGEFKIDPATGEQLATKPPLTQLLRAREEIVWPEPLATAKLVLPYPQWAERSYYK